MGDNPAREEGSRPNTPAPFSAEPRDRTQYWYHVRRKPDQKTPPPAELHTGKRFQLWIDGVGGFLVCLGDEILIGQPDAERKVDVAILGDVSGRHAVVRRDGEGYLLEARRPLRIDGREVASGVAVNLRDGALLEIGQGVRLKFRQPHALSCTARLERLSPHRLQPAADAVLLMADSLVLGPQPSSHVQCHGWTHDVILYWQGGELKCRSTSPLVIDGQAAGRGRLTLDSRVTGDEFALSLEAL